MSRGAFSVLGITSLILQVMCVVKVVSITWPYMYSPPKSYSSLSYSVPTRIAFIDVTKRGEEISSRVVKLIEAKAPDVLIINRYTDTSLIGASEGLYPYVLRSSLSSERTVEVFSKSPIPSPTRSEYGFGALPGVFGIFETADGVRFQLGAMDLLLSFSQEAFNRSRLTSRRLASALKYSSQPRIVVGAFRASITSQLVDMYVDQLKLRSLFFNSGVGSLVQSFIDALYLSRNVNAFMARNIEVDERGELRSDVHGFVAVSFTVRIPRTELSLLGTRG